MSRDLLELMGAFQVEGVTGRFDGDKVKRFKPRSRVVDTEYSEACDARITAIMVS